MALNETLNLVLPVVSDDTGVRIWAYHTPISRAVFEANYRVLSATKAAIGSKGSYYQVAAGPRVAALTLRDEGKRDAESYGPFDKEGAPTTVGTDAFFAEIKRLTMVLCPTAAGWSELPADVALSTGAIDEEEWSEAESAIVFFTCHWSLAKKSERGHTARSTAGVLSASITPSTSAAWLASLPKSTPEKTSKAVASSVPS